MKPVFLNCSYFQIEKPISSINSKRPLPIDKRMVKDFEYGMQEPETVTPGMTTIRLALEFITEHNIKPEVANVEYVSKTYNLKPEITGNYHEVTCTSSIRRDSLCLE